MGDVNKRVFVRTGNTVLKGQITGKCFGSFWAKLDGKTRRTKLLMNDCIHGKDAIQQAVKAKSMDIPETLVWWFCERDECTTDRPESASEMSITASPPSSRSPSPIAPVDPPPARASGKSSQSERLSRWPTDFSRKLYDSEGQGKTIPSHFRYSAPEYSP